MLDIRAVLWLEDYLQVQCVCLCVWCVCVCVCVCVCYVCVCVCYVCVCVVFTHVSSPHMGVYFRSTSTGTVLAYCTNCLNTLPGCLAIQPPNACIG